MGYYFMVLCALVTATVRLWFIVQLVEHLATHLAVARTKGPKVKCTDWSTWTSFARLRAPSAEDRTTINGMISDTDAYQKRVFAALMGGCECKAPLGVIGGCSCTKRCAAGFVMFAPHYTERVAWPTADQQRQWCGGESDDDDGE